MGSQKIYIPNFFLIGAAKAGTTSLYRYLEQHPNIYISPIKEPNYFSNDIDVNKFSPMFRKKNFLDNDAYFNNHELKEIHLSFVRKPEHYQRLFENAHSQKAIGECSTSYLYSSVAAHNIFNFNPNSKIIVILRNPIERAFSHYIMALKYGYTSLGFYDALKKDIQSNSKGWGISELFIELGQYYHQLKRYFDVFQRDNIHIMLFENFINQPNEELNKVFDFLKLDSFNIEKSNAENQGQIPKYKTFNRIVGKSGIKKTLLSFITDGQKEKLKSKLFDSKSKLAITNKEASFLLDIYENDIEKTADLIKYDLKHWIKTYSSTS